MGQIYILLASILVLATIHGGKAKAQDETTAHSKGVTFTYHAPKPDGTALLNCGMDGNGDPLCEPYVGDTRCETALPVVCFLDINVPAPSYLETSKYWSGGVIALSDPVQATQFKTITAANGYCAANFGEGWRVASFHDGGGWGIRAYGHAGLIAKQVWIDIKDQPSATCWQR